MIRKNNINSADFLTLWENVEKMGREERMEAVLEACRRLLEAGLEGLDAILLFGSFARGEDDRRSDIDLLLLYETEEDALKAEDNTAKVAAGMSNANISIINKSYRELAGNPYFAFEVARDAIVLYKRLSRAPLKAEAFPLKPFYIYVFDMRNLSQAEKSRVTVALYGRRKGKYAYKGLLESLNGYRLGNGAVMVPARAFRKIEEFFSLNKINYRRIAVSLLFGDL